MSIGGSIRGSQEAGGRRRRHYARYVATVSACCAGLLGLVGLSTSAAAGGTTWSVTDLPYQNSEGGVPFAPLYSIGAISASDVWAVGRVSGAPLTENWNGSKWSSVALPAGPCSVFENTCQLTGVSGDSAGDVFAVGTGTINSESSAGFVATPLAFHWNGSAWKAMTLPSGLSSTALQHVEAFSPTDAWAVGITGSESATVASAEQWNGTTWTQVETPISTKGSLAINAISGSSANDIWVVGETSTGGYRNRQVGSVIMHYNGSSWSLQTVPDNSGLIAVDALSPSDAWTLAADGSVLNWNGTSWSVKTEESGASTLTALSATDLWVGGVVSIGHYNGSSWSTTPTPTTISHLSSATAFAPGHVWFAGDSVEENGDEVPVVLSTSNG